jgi:hypothetical protein
MSRMWSVIATAVLLGASACTHQRAYLNYEDSPGEIQMRAGGWDGERLGVVRASEGGPIWKDCTDVAEASIWMLMEATRELGGNAIGEFRWVPQHPKHSSDAPTCRQRWGWFLVWPAVLSPAFQSAGVEAAAYLVDGPEAAREGLYIVPESEVERMLLAQRIASEVVSGE